MKAEYKQIHWHFFTNQRNWQHRYTRRRKTEQKHNTIGTLLRSYTYMGLGIILFRYPLWSTV